MQKKDLNETLKRFKAINEYSFYVGEDDIKGKDDEGKDLILGEDEENPEADAEPELDLPEDNKEVEDLTGDAEVEDLSGDAEVEDLTGDVNPLDMEAPGIDSPEMTDNGDEVEVDVTSIVKGSEEAKAAAELSNAKMEELLNNFKELENKLSAMSALSTKIDNLEQEIEKRNPTPEERLEMRSLSSYPFNQKLTDYWSEKEGIYDVMNKNGEKKETEYVLDKDAIESDYNPNTVKNSFNANEYEEEDI
jgi:hypothetical protein